MDLLAPPRPGLELRGAVATTFTLDLTALLGIPLRFAGMEAVGAEADLPILSAVDRYAERIDVFCQAGNVFVPAGDASLLAFLESSVHQVKAAPGGLFHPKLWVLRYADESGEEAFRLVCGSRNLTNDRSWDTAVVLDGHQTNRRHAVNGPLADFMLSLPSRVPTGVPTRRIARIEEMSEALRSVEWEAPPGTRTDREWLKFHVFSAKTRKRPDMSGRRRLIVSPFLTDDGLDRVWPGGKGECQLVSRPDELNCLEGAARQQMEAVGTIAHVLNDAVALHDLDSDEHGLRHELSGLHSKLYVVERDHRAHVFVGSANATDAAWRNNDEILVEIVGRGKDMGVAATAGEDGFGALTEPHLFGEPAEPSDADKLRLKLENYLRHLAAIPWTATVSGGDPEFSCRLAGAGEIGELPEGASAHKLMLRPLTRSDFQILAPGDPPSLMWTELAMTEITPFFVARVSDGAGTTVESVMLARLVGDPSERRARILAEQFSDTSRFVQFVMMLLQLSSDGELALGQATGGEWLGASSAATESAGLLESTLDALCDSPAAVEEIEKIVEQLERTDRGRELLPEGWSEFWASVLAAHELIGAARG